MKALLTITLTALILMGCDKPTSQEEGIQSIQKSFADKDIKNMTIDDFKKGSSNESSEKP